jgi:hypothetical protein
MIGYWHTIHPDETRHVWVSLGAHLGGYELIVERCSGESCWHWMVRTQNGHEIESGTAPYANAAERLAEEAAFHVHPPSVGDWIGRLI